MEERILELSRNDLEHETNNHDKDDVVDDDVQVNETNADYNDDDDKRNSVDNSGENETNTENENNNANNVEYNVDDAVIEFMRHIPDDELNRKPSAVNFVSDEKVCKLYLFTN